MHTTNYFNVFISVADDCPVNRGEIPPNKNPKSAAQITHEMVADHPYGFTSDDVVYAANGKRRNISREEFFSKGQPCLRSSPLSKRYGWGIHSNAEGKIAIYPIESQEYKTLLEDPSLKQLKGIRSRRA